MVRNVRNGCVVDILELKGTIRNGTEKERFSALYIAASSLEFEADGYASMTSWLKGEFDGYQHTLSEEVQLAKFQVQYFGFDELGVVDKAKTRLLAKLKMDRDRKEVIEYFEGASGLSSTPIAEIKMHLKLCYPEALKKKIKTKEERNAEIVSAFLAVFVDLDIEDQINVVSQINSRFERVPEFQLRVIAQKLAEIKHAMNETKIALKNGAYFFDSPDLYAYSDKHLE